MYAVLGFGHSGMMIKNGEEHTSAEHGSFFTEKALTIFSIYFCCGNGV